MTLRSKRTNNLIVLALSSTVVFITTARADIINVPGDQRTIQAAIIVAVNGDEIIVAPGTYTETIDFLGKAITVRSTDPDDPDVVNSTIIDGNGAGSVVTCDTNEGPDSVLSGFVITGGSGTDIDGFTIVGGGMYNVNSSPTVTNCSFVSNSVKDLGGGMYNLDSSPNVTNCSFVANMVNGIVAFGGGIYSSGGSLTVTNCLFSANVIYALNYCVNGDSAYAAGGGIYAVSSNLTVTDCTFIGNSATAATRYAEGGANTSQAGGGGMYIGGGSSSVTNCSFSGNSVQASAKCYGGLGASASGGGMINFLGSHTVTNCSFIGNSAAGAHDGGFNSHAGGLLSSNSTTVTDSQFCGNSPDQTNGNYTDGGGNEINMICPPVKPVPDPCTGDLDGDGSVGVSDLLALFANWGLCK